MTQSSVVTTQDFSTAQGETADIEAIKNAIPHRYPMLMIDRVLNIRVNESAIGIKNVSVNEWFFQGHFPDRPILPGVLIVEAMAQTAGVLVVKTLGKECEGKLVYFMSIEEAKFRKPVVPGDVLQLRVTKDRARGNVWKFKGEAWVGDTLKAEAVFTAMILKE